VGFLLLLGYIEEGFWNIWVWHEPRHTAPNGDRPYWDKQWLFSASDLKKYVPDSDSSYSIKGFSGRK
jgi:hypothetical protein